MQVIFAGVLATALIALAPATPASNLTVRELVDRHTEARGGREALQAIHSLEYSLRIEEPGYTVDAVYRIQRAGRMRIDIFADGNRVFSEGYDGLHAWQWPQDKRYGEPVSEDGEAALLHGIQLPIHINGLHQMTHQGHLVGYLGMKQFNGKDTYGLKIVLKDHTEVFYFLDPDTWQIIGNRDFRAFHPAVDSEKKWHETRFSDFREVEGVTRAFVSENYDLKTGERVGRTTITDIKVNPKFEAGFFQKP